MQPSTRTSPAQRADGDGHSVNAYTTLQRSGWPSWVPLNTDLPVEARLVAAANLPSRPRGKYRPLYDYLAKIRLTETTLRLADFPEHVGIALPASAFKHQAFWANQRSTAARPWTMSWHAAGFRIDKIHLAGSEGWVRFRRRT